LQTNPQPENRPHPRRKEVINTLLYFALLAAGVFAAWQIHVWWTRQHRGVVEPPPDALRAIPERGGDVGVRSLLNASRPADLTGLEELKSDPDGLVPPAQSRRLRMFRQVLGGQQRQLAKYESPGTVDEVGRYYLELLKSRGYRLLSDRSSDANRSLVFEQDPRQVSILMEKKVSQEGLVSIVLVLTCPAPIGPEAAPKRPSQSAPARGPG
jgi:hypothetical protein